MSELETCDVVEHRDRATVDGGLAIAETDGAYFNLRLNDRWRVIECGAGIQWILQYRANSPETYSTAIWRGRSYCRTREALIRCCNAHAGEIDPSAVAAFEALPERIEVEQ
jgi:hypothetical protein